jgi:hypothetical protein
MAKFLEVRFSDGYWRIPAHIIADNRAKYYSDDPDTTYDDEYKFTIEDEYELCDWAGGNMNWSDLKAHAVHVKPLAIDYEDEWLHASKDVVEVPDNG